MKYTEQLLREKVLESKTIRELLEKINAPLNSSSFAHIRRKLDKYEIDTSHFTYSSKRLKHGKIKTNLSYLDVLVFDRNSGLREHSVLLRKCLIESGKEYKCENCKISQWNHKKLSLEIDHINGNRIDNRKENLRFLCPNCHSQVEDSKRKEKTVCCICSKQISLNSKYCIKCHLEFVRPKQSMRPSKDNLLNDLKVLDKKQILKKYKIHRNTLNKWKNYYDIKA